MHRTLPRITQLALALGLVALAGCTTTHQHGHHHPHFGGGGSEAGLTVVGTGEAKAAPDVARSSIGIEVRDESAEAATNQANERMAAVIAAIKGAGVPDGDVRTHDFSISFERDFTPPQPVVQVQTAPAGKGAKPVAAAQPAPAEPRGIYRVSNTVEVTVRDIGKISQVLTAATKAGANNVWGVSFELSDRAPLYAKAREQAIANARRDAEQLAKLTGVKLGRIISVDDQAEGNAAPVYARGLAMAKTADAPVPIEQGELTVTHQVRLVYALDHED